MSTDSRSRLVRRWILVLAALVICGLVVTAADLALTWGQRRADITALLSGVPPKTTYMRLESRQGERSAPHHFVPLDSIAPVAVCAVLAAEDHAFFEHGPVDVRMQRRILAHLLQGDLSYGGSSITQQLARNLFLGPDRTPRRKLRELLLAAAVGAEVGKERQLELYLNLVEWGPTEWGIAAASHRWFHKEPGELTPSEAILLATMLPAPERGLHHALAPATAALRRRILWRLREAGHLDELGAGATRARLERWAMLLRRGVPDAVARQRLDLELGPEPLVTPSEVTGRPWRTRCQPQGAAASLGAVQ